MLIKVIILSKIWPIQFYFVTLQRGNKKVKCMKGKVIFFSVIAIIVALVWYAEYDLNQKRKHVDMEVEMMMSCMDYDCVKAHYNAHYMKLIHDNYGTINTDSVVAEITSNAKKSVDSCFNTLFANYDEDEVLNAYKEKTSVSLKSKEDFMVFHTNIVTAMAIENVAREISTMSLL